MAACQGWAEGTGQARGRWRGGDGEARPHSRSCLHREWHRPRKFVAMFVVEASSMIPQQGPEAGARMAKGHRIIAVDEQTLQEHGRFWERGARLHRRSSLGRSVHVRMRFE